jgi:hypothetical protein
MAPVRSYVRVTIPFVDADAAERFAERHDDAVLLRERVRQRSWVQVDLELDGPDIDLELIRVRYGSLAGIPASEHVRAYWWPTPDFDTPLDEQLEALFGADHARRPLAIGFYPTGAGWARAVVAGPSGAIELSASYLSDALGDLGALANVMLRGDPVARSSFAEEPGEFRWVARRSGERVKLSILSFRDWGDEPDERGQLLLKVECTVEQLAEAVLACLDDVLTRYGEAGYRGLWVDHDFPTLEREALRRQLGV